MYSTGGSASLDGSEATVGSVSLACLSCHDGSLAVATMINKPGSGGYTATTGSILAGTWTNSDATGGVDPATGKMRVGAIQNLGSDLVNDHPISIQYCGGGLSGAGTTVSGTCVDADFKPAKTKVVNTNQVFWVDTTIGTADVREKTDIALYTRTSGGLGPMVECASCHDPHTTANPTFLRVSNTGSGLCLSCHTK
jgi:predicted CXXCH cytochrome family protein